MTANSILGRLKPFLLTFFVGCAIEGGDNDLADRGPLDGKADQVTGSCLVEDCGGQSSTGSGWCDTICAQFGDCAEGVADVCGFDECVDTRGCHEGEECVLGYPNRCELSSTATCDDGTVAAETYYIDSADGKECAMSSDHCLTNESDACPQLEELPPDFCADGSVSNGQVSFVASGDGKECAMPSVHCLTNDFDACPQLEELPPDFCAGGVVVSGPPSYVPSADGKECAMPSIHCLTGDEGACPASSSTLPESAPPPPSFCQDGTLVTGQPSYIASADGKECAMPSLHCLTDDFGSCPQLEELPPDFCADGTVVSGVPSFTFSADGKECEMPSVHCLTSDLGACPQWEELPPDFCVDGTVVAAQPGYVASTDGMECALPSVHCLTVDSDACPLL